MKKIVAKAILWFFGIMVLFALSAPIYCLYGIRGVILASAIFAFFFCVSWLIGWALDQL